jgi:raffinose/stachyose/melibiose transport system permease protein
MRTGRRIKKHKALGRLLTEGIMVIMSLLVLFPIVYQLIASFKNRADVNRPLSFPTYLYVENYKEALVEGRFGILLVNSLLVVSLSLILIVVFGSLASYAMARSRVKGYKYLYYYFLSGIMIPFMAGMIPLYKMIKALGLIDNILSLVFISVGTCIPMSVLIFTGFIKSVPVQLEEAALIDGCGVVRTFIFIVFPLLKPAIVSTLIVNMIPIWNDFLTPLLFLSSDTHKTLPLGMYNFMSERTINMGPIFGFSVLVCVLPIVLFISLQKYFYKGIVAGAVKG